MTEQESLESRGRWTSASNAQADLLCPGRHKAQLGIPEKQSDDAAFGTAIHAALAKQDPAGLTTEQESIYESMLAIDDRLLAEFFPNAAGDRLPPMRERRLWIKWADGLHHSGQVDVAYIVGWRALIVEYKTLPGDQPASPKNLQLRDQAILFDMAVPGLKEIGVAVNQPLVTHSPEVCIYQKADIDRARDELYMRVRASNQPDAQRIPGVEQCKYCRAKLVCVEYGKIAGQIVTAGSEPAQALSATAVASWTPAMRSLYMDRRDMAKKWMESCDDEIRAILERDPDAVPGYTLKSGKNRSNIVNPEAVFESFAKAGGTLAQFMDCISVGKTDLKEAVKAATQLKGKKLDDAVAGIIGENIETKQDRPSITKKS